MYVYIPLTTHTQQMDVCVTVRVLRKALIGVILVSVSASTNIEGDAGITLSADTTLQQLHNVHEFACVIAPGGNTSYVAAVAHDRSLLVGFSHLKIYHNDNFYLRSRRVIV